MSSRTRMLGAGRAGSTSYGSNVNMIQFGDKLQGLAPQATHFFISGNGQAGWQNYQTRTNAPKRNYVFCMNQLGGVGRGKSQFKVDGVNNPDGSKTCHPYLYDPKEALNEKDEYHKTLSGMDISSYPFSSSSIELSSEPKLPTECGTNSDQKIDYSLPVYKTEESTYYSRGYEIGKKAKERIEKYIIADTHFHTLVKYVNTIEGTAIFNGFIETNTRAYPDYMRELKGIADGAGIPERLLQINTLSHELSYFAEIEGNRQCGDILLNSKNCTAIAHNEDARPIYATGMYMIDTRTNDGGWLAFSYPGKLPGWAYGFNKFISYTVDDLYPTPTAPASLAINFVGRDVLEATSLNDAIIRATVSGQASGMALNIYDNQTGEMVNVETSPGLSTGQPAESGTYAVRRITGHIPYFHANNYLSLSTTIIEDLKTTGISLLGNPNKKISVTGRDYSSTMRLKRAEQIINEQPKKDVASIKTLIKVLGDTANECYPIFRRPQKDGCDPDTTLTTTLFNFNKKTMEVWVGKNPLCHPKPDLNFPLGS